MVLALFPVLSLLAASPRPQVDVSAMREALEAPTERYSSASAYAHFLRARLFGLSGEHQKSVEQLRLALASDPGRPELLLALAEAQARAGETARAEATARSLLERRPDHVPALLFLGRLLFETDRPDRAREVLARARKLAPREPEPYLISAELSLEAGTDRGGGAHGAGTGRRRPRPDRSQAPGRRAARARRAGDRPDACWSGRCSSTPAMPRPSERRGRPWRRWVG